ncbi:hypothetical protein GP486_002857 [Trichoglossum hirsutum]|uniref:Uncharacterized protein n=1 Tax=Trichoglossum hirsutum TaxID=265104 RepID=A0A9P8RRB8_9PEZI|nr:hypothetical protein GP486_002857 [Trichoglossum hirsutum]
MRIRGYGVFNSFLVMVLEALRQGRAENDPSNTSGGLGQAKLAIATSISVLECQSKLNEAANLYLKISRSLDRSLNRVLAAGSGHGFKWSPESYSPSPQSRGLPYGWPEKQSEMRSQLPSVFGVESTEPQPSSTGEYFAFGREQRPELYGAEAEEAAEASIYSHTGGIPNRQAMEASIDESIDPSLLESSQDYPQQGSRKGSY